MQIQQAFCERSHRLFRRAGWPSLKRRRPRRYRTIPLVVLLVQSLAGCTPFGGVRSAQARPGVHFNGLVSIASSPGDVAGRLLGNDIDCTIGCRGSILGTELGLAYGLRTTTAHPLEPGVGATGNFIPFADGFVPLGHGSHPYGIGARVGATGDGSTYRSLSGRHDAPLRNGQRLLWNPALTQYVASSTSAVARALALSNTLGLNFELDFGTDR